MYAYAHCNDTNIGYQYGSVSASISASIVKAKNWIQTSVASEKEQAFPLFDNQVNRKMIKAQEATLAKIWDGAENDAWDELYKKLNA